MRYKIIELTKDIENPDADRRVRRDWRAWPVLKAGRRFVFTCREERFARDMRPAYVSEVTAFRDGGPVPHRAPASGGIGKAVEENSVEVALSALEFRDVLAVIDIVYHCPASVVLEALFNQNAMITGQTMLDAIERYEREESTAEGNESE